MPGNWSAATDDADGVAGAAEVMPDMELMPELEGAGVADFVNDPQPPSSNAADTSAAAAVVPDLTDCLLACTVRLECPGVPTRRACQLAVFRGRAASQAAQVASRCPL